MKGRVMHFPFRWRAAGLHALISSLVAAVAAVLVFGLWFPGAYRHLSGGVGLFALIVGVDVVLGPLLTLVAFSPGKTRRHLAADLSVIAFLQLAALAYGLYTVSQVRPVALVAENNLFRVVAAQDIKPDELDRVPPGLELGWRGPKVVGTRVIQPGEDRMEVIDWALRGYDVGTRPSLWQDYALSRERVLSQSVPLLRVFAAQLGRHAELDAAVRATGRAPEQLRVQQVYARQPDWYVLLDAQDATVCGFVRVAEAD